MVINGLNSNCNHANKFCETLYCLFRPILKKKGDSFLLRKKKKNKTKNAFIYFSFQVVHFCFQNWQYRFDPSQYPSFHPYIQFVFLFFIFYRMSIITESQNLQKNSTFSSHNFFCFIKWCIISDFTSIFRLYYQKFTPNYSYFALISSFWRFI
jgi:hypothetical protein